MKYRAIYNVIHESSDTTMKDFSVWFKTQLSIVEKKRPLWIILENVRLKLRIWVFHEYGELKISTASMAFDCRSKEYSDSRRHYKFNTQAELADRLKKLLNGDGQEVA